MKALVMCDELMRRDDDKDATQGGMSGGGIMSEYCGEKFDAKNEVRHESINRIRGALLTTNNNGDRIILTHRSFNTHNDLGTLARRTFT